MRIVRFITIRYTMYQAKVSNNPSKNDFSNGRLSPGTNRKKSVRKDVCDEIETVGSEANTNARSVPLTQYQELLVAYQHLRLEQNMLRKALRAFRISGRRFGRAYDD